MPRRDGEHLIIGKNHDNSVSRKSACHMSAVNTVLLP